MSGRLTVHVLDTALGRPAAGMALTLERIAPVHAMLGAWRTNDDGRCDAPLLDAAAMQAGTYQIVFDVGAWRAARGDADGGFYDFVPIRFRIVDEMAHHHVPLLISPYGYATYRGS